MNTVKYVELKIQASGFGCVNTNGNINPATGEEGAPFKVDGKVVKNFVWPKKRGDKMYISSNCIRAHLFGQDTRGILLGDALGFTNSDKKGQPEYTAKKIEELSQDYASSYVGLLRGYMLTEKSTDSVKRDSPLMVTDFINQTDNVNKSEVMVNHLAYDENGEKSNNSLFHQESWGDTSYTAEAVISIQKLQFIALDNRLGHQDVRFSSNAKKDNTQEKLTSFINRLVESIKEVGRKCGMRAEAIDNIRAQHGLYQKNEAQFKYEEEGILLSNEAIHALVIETVQRFKQLNILKSKSFMKVDQVKLNLSHQFQASTSTELSPTQIPDYTTFYTRVEEQ